MAEETMLCYRHPNRETGVTCSECGRPICPDCMVFAPVGIRCPDHSGQPQGAQRVARQVRLPGVGGSALVTRALIALNIGVFLVNLADGASLTRNSGDVFIDGALIGRAFDPVANELIGVAEGEWWRLITSAFLHGSIVHLGMNMLMLYWIGAPIEEAIGRARFLLLYVVSGLAGSAGALLLTEPQAVTVGASGAIFGMLGAALVFETQRTFVLGGSALSIIVLNLVLTFAIPNISIGGHLGGLAGGALGGLALSRFGRVHAVYGRPGVIGFAGLVAVGLASVLVAYFRVETFV